MDTTFKKLPPARREEILYAAAEVFAEFGYWRANINSICDKAGISNGALYRYFKNKESLYIYIFNHVSRIMQAAYKINMENTNSIYDIIRQMLFNTVSFYKRTPAYFMLFADIWSESMNELVEKVDMQAEKDIDQFWIQLVEKGRAEGEISQGISPRYAAYLIDSQTLLFFFSIASTYHQKRFDVFLRDKNTLSYEELIDKLVENLRLCLSPK